MTSCHKATELLSQSQERALTLSENSRLMLHLILCAGCRNFKQQTRTLRMVAQTFAKGARPPENPTASPHKKPD